MHSCHQPHKSQPSGFRVHGVRVQRFGVQVSGLRVKSFEDKLYGWREGCRVYQSLGFWKYRNSDYSELMK